MANTQATLDKVVSWAKRRGFVFLTSDIYGGLANNYDYGPYGTLLKNNIRDLWWKRFVLQRDDVVGMDGSIITHPQVWHASGHVSSFSDPMVEDKVNHKRYRADHLLETWLSKSDNLTKFVNAIKEGHVIIEESKIVFSFLYGRTELQQEAQQILSDRDRFYEELKRNIEIGLDIISFISNESKPFLFTQLIKSPDGNPLSEPREFNLLFETQVGALEGDKSTAYLRGETAQAIFVNYKNVIDTMRVKIPFGIAQIGKAFRNEITKGQFIFRTIEFEQMELEYFIHPEADWEPMMQSWLEDMKAFYLELGAAESDLRFRQHSEEELSHYSKRTYDPEYHFDIGWKEIAGLAHRTDYDLKQHAEFSGKKLEYRDPYTNEVYVPHVLEPSFGLSRAVLLSMYAAYNEEDLGEGNTRTVMKFPKAIAPIKAAIFPLQKDEQLEELATKIYHELKQAGVVCEYDNSGNIGKMYRRQDEIGTPVCITIDYDSLKDNTVTVRDRDTMQQQRIKVEEVFDFVKA